MDRLEEKKCAKCKENLSSDSFYVIKSGHNKNKLSSWCKHCQTENAYYHKHKDLDKWKVNQKNYRTKNKDKDRNRVLLKLCGITLEYFNSLPKFCTICGSTEKLRPDHCHTSGKFRNILCNNCNAGLGFFRDDTNLLAKAVEYLNEHSSEVKE